MGERVRVGAFCILDATRGPITLGDEVELLSNVVIQGPCSVGARTRVYPFACLGFEPQDYKHPRGAPTPGVVIGADCLVRESVTVHAATKTERPTTVGDKCFLMVGSHLGHDARIGNNVVLVNDVALAGHVEVNDNATIGGGTVVHQFNRIGRLAFVSGGSAFTTDVPPFCMAYARNRLAGLNLVGLRRNGVSRDHITTLRELFRLTFMRRLPNPEVVAVYRAASSDCPLAGEVADFVASAKRAVTPYYSSRAGLSDGEL